MRSFNRFMGIAALVLVIVMIGSIIFASSYISSHRELLSELGINSHGNAIQWNWPFSSNERSSHYETLTQSDESTFTLPESIILDIGTDELVFIEEDRTDILVEYINEYPDTPLYQIDYQTEMKNDNLYITSSQNIKSLYLDKDYESRITVHVPQDFELDTLDLTMSMGEITQQSIMNKVNNLILSANLGDIDVEIDSPKDSLNIDCAMGSIELDVNAPVKTLDCQASFGEVNLNLGSSIAILSTSADMGSINITAESDIQTVELTAQMGSITGNFDGRVDKLTANCDMGSINLEMEKTDGITAYIDADMGSVEIDDDIDLVKENDEPDYKLSAQMGDIEIKNR